MPHKNLQKAWEKAREALDKAESAFHLATPESVVKAQKAMNSCQKHLDKAYKAMQKKG